MVRADRRKFHYIYKITRNNSDRYYIGMHSTDNLEDGYFGSGTRLWRSIDKYGKENHTKEILEFCESREQLRIREKELIGDLHRLDEACMNLVPGGNGGCSKYSQLARSKAGGEAVVKKLKSDPEFRIAFGLKIGKGLISFYEQNPNAKKITDNYSWSGKKHCAEAKKKMSDADRTGEKNSQFGMQWVYNTLLKECKRIGKDELIPEGWSKGRKMKF